MRPEITAEYLREQGLSEDFPKRFWKKVNKNGPITLHCADLGPCWIWTAATVWCGYGSIWRGTAPGKFIRAHRAAYILCHGPIPDGFDILHRCDNPSCVAPQHIWAGDAKENSQDALKKGRLRTPWGINTRGEKHPLHKLTDAQVLEIRRRFVKGKGFYHRGTSRLLATEFGVDQSHIHLIVKRKIWRHI